MTRYPDPAPQDIPPAVPGAAIYKPMYGPGGWLVLMKTEHHTATVDTAATLAGAIRSARRLQLRENLVVSKRKV